MTSYSREVITRNSGLDVVAQLRQTLVRVEIDVIMIETRARPSKLAHFQRELTRKQTDLDLNLVLDRMQLG